MITRTNKGPATLDSMNIDLDDIVEQVNRQTDQLDSFNKGLTVIAKGTFTFSWDGTVAGASTANNQFDHSLGYAPIFLAYYQWSGDPAGQWFPLDDIRFDATGTATWWVQSFSTNISFAARLNVAQAGSASTFTVAYFLLKEPAQAQ